MKTILTICTGNICRSPMAEVVLKCLLAEKNVENVAVKSAAISSEEVGNPIYYLANEVLLKHGYNRAFWENHRAKKVTLHDLQSADLILPMTRHHYDFLVKMMNGDDSKIFMYRWFENPRNLHTARDLEDPWFGGMREFEIALAQIETNSRIIVERF